MKEMEWILKWYHNHCDGDWEHTYGITIQTLDNPGWYIDIDLNETELENVTFESIFVERSENDWFACKVENKTFKGNGGPFNLNEMLHVFRTWAEKNQQ